MEEQNSAAVVYNVTVKTPEGEEKRKAFDMVSLKQFLEEKRAMFSILNLDANEIENKESVHKFIAKAAQAVLYELEDSINQSLGIAPQEPIEEEEPEQEAAEPQLAPAAPAAPLAPEPTQPQVAQPTEPVIPEVAEMTEKDNKIVL